MPQEKIDSLKVYGSAIAATGISIANINAYLTTISVLIAIGYGLRKWYLMEKNKTNEK